MSTTDEFLEANASYDFPGPLPSPPARKTVVVACMDARLDPAKVFGFKEGDAHVIRNAGGVVTDDTIRSLTISQRLLGTSEIVLLHHTECGMLTFNDDDFRHDIEKETGIRPTWSAETFGDLDEDIARSIRRIKSSPFVPHTDQVRGFIYDVDTGKVREVVAD